MTRKAPARSWLSVALAAVAGALLAVAIVLSPHAGPLSAGLKAGLVALLGGALGAVAVLHLQRLAERRRMEAALTHARRDHEAALRALADRQGLETLGRLTAGVAHDIGNVMQSVEFYLKAMPAALDDRPTLLRLIERARGTSRRGAAGARDLLALARGSARRPEPIDVVPLLTEIADAMQELFGESITVRLDLPPTLPPVLAEAGDLEAMLINLATNSRDAMAPAGHGVLSIAAAMVGSPDSAPPTDNLPGGEWVRILITDTGVGMDPETLARATEPFFTTKPRGRGTGLGLALAHEFAERSGGMLIIESNVGTGTRASLFLHPATDERANPDADPDDAAAGTDAGHRQARSSRRLDARR
jgi:signal transduction histidine kinase